MCVRFSVQPHPTEGGAAEPLRPLQSPPGCPPHAVFCCLARCSYLQPGVLQRVQGGGALGVVLWAGGGAGEGGSVGSTTTIRLRTMTSRLHTQAIMPPPR